jgi:hypothetical protein
LSNPEREFNQINKRSFESIVGDYMWLLVTVAIVTGLLNFLFSIVKAIYLDIFLNIDVQYWRMINYSFGRAFSLLFLYIFAGTFLIFFISILLRPFFHKIKYIDFLGLLLYSLAPLLLFAWIPFNPTPLIIWSIFLFAVGVSSYKAVGIKKGSIQQRD